MTEIQKESSSSDISTNSWTLLDESLHSDKENSSDSLQDIEDIAKTEHEASEERHEDTKEESKRKNDGFLTFDEYLQERLLEHDYEQQETPRKLRRMYRNKIKKCFGRCKEPYLRISHLLLIILAVSALAILCSKLSKPPIKKAVENAHFKAPVKASVSTTNLNKMLEQFNETIKDLEQIKKTEILPAVKNKTDNTIPERIIPEEIQVKKPFIGPKNKPQEREWIFPSYPRCDRKVHKVRGTTRSKWLILKDILLDTNLHALVSLIMTNIYLFALFTDFAKKPTPKSKYQMKQTLLEQLEKSNNIEDVRKYLFKELPFRNAEYTAKNSKGTSKKLSLTSRPSQSIKSVTVCNSKKSLDKFLVRSCSEHDTNSVLPPSIFETGKSECQRRFEELDHRQKKYENLKQDQKKKIKLLKQKFKNEVSFIKDTEEESEARAEKINRTSQMFIKKLKTNREKYLMELKKVKELRKKVAEDRKKENRKDAAIGTYSFSLPPIYDYGEKFKMIKEKFERENNEIPKQFKFQ